MNRDFSYHFESFNSYFFLGANWFENKTQSFVFFEIFIIFDLRKITNPVKL